MTRAENGWWEPEDGKQAGSFARNERYCWDVDDVCAENYYYYIDEKGTGRLPEGMFPLLFSIFISLLSLSLSIYISLV